MTVSTAAAAQRSLDEVERMAAQMARYPGRETVWAIERIRVIADADWCHNAAAWREIRNVLAALDLAEQRRRAVAS
jgi:hypothetical protein